MHTDALLELDRLALARLGREYMVAAQLNSRAGYAALRINHGDAAYKDTAIDNWMAVSPVYTRRMQRAMGFAGGDDVATIFKGLQLECGFAHQYMDVHFEVDAADSGRFWLHSCGPLLETEPRGEDAVRVMCHDIEDPTFDATAAATPPRIMMRPLHRPPRNDSGLGNGAHRYPHCRWKVFKGEENTGFEHTPVMYELQRSLLAAVPLVRQEDIVEAGGLEDYSGPFDPHLQFEDFSQRALQLIIQENAIQALLLAHSFTRSQTIHYGDAVGRRFSERSWVGHARVAVERLRRLPGLQGDDIETMAKLFQLHPHFYPRSYVDFRVEITGAASLRVSIGDCPALHEEIPHNWFSQLSPEPHPALESLAAHVNPHARCHGVSAPGEARLAWEIHIDAGNAPLPEPLEMQIARTSGGMEFEFERRRLPGLIARG